MRSGLNPSQVRVRKWYAERHLKLWSVGLLLVVIAALSLFPAYGVSAQAPDREPPTTFEGLDSTPKEGHPRLDSRLYQVMEAGNAEGNMAALALGEDIGLDLTEGRVRAMVVADPEVQGEVERAVRVLGGQVETRYLDLMQVLVPLDALDDLVQVSGVDHVRPPLEPQLAEESQGVARIGSDVWQEAGWEGNGVKVAILDLGFFGYTGLLGSDLPSSVTPMSFRADLDITGGGESHGTACAEVVHDMAPEAQLYLVNYSTEAEMGNAVNWLISQGVDVISHSVVWLNAGPYDGTGAFCDMVASARANGILWAQAAGNYAQQHYQGTYVDLIGNHDFGAGYNYARISRGAGDQISAYLSWDDWTNVDQDYDLYLRRWTGSWEVIASSTNFQTGQPGQKPIEAISIGAPATDNYYLFVRRWNSTRDVYLELYSIHHGFLDGIGVSSSSLAIPADSSSAVAVGAVHHSNDVLESFSSHGPPNGPGGTGEGTIVKPDLVGPDGVQVITPFYNPFGGTSASTPHIAGAAAQVMEAYPWYSVSEVQDYLETHVVDLGTAGKDNSYGAGRPDLPDYDVFWIWPRGALNTEPVHIDNIGGVGFEDVFSATLTRSGESDIEGTSLNVESPGKISCDFDISGTMPGLWDVVVTDITGTATLQGGSYGFLVATDLYSFPVILKRE